MKRYALFSLLLLLVMQFAYTQENYCDPQVPKIQFEGKAPAPWAIDGSTIDWQTLIGPYSGDPLLPYNPAENTGNNWSFDGFVPDRYNDLDSPAARNDIRFFAQTSDDYNVYFYVRQQLNTGGEHSLFYFIDVNVNGFMNNGEPVLQLQYNKNKVTRLTVGAYVVNPDEGLGQTGGNYMTSPGPSYQGYADGYTISGSVKELFSASKIPDKEALQEGEVFAAAVTEEGYGLEISIPWRYLRDWIDNSYILQGGDLFAYHTALQVGGGPYMPQRVVDNAGGCCGGLAIVGNPSVAVSDLQFSVLEPGTAYRFRFTFTNNTNIEEQIGVKRIIIDNITLAAGAELDNTAFRIWLYRDDECSGKADNAGKSAQFDFYSEPSEGVVIYSTLTSIARSVKPGESVCFVADLVLPPDQFTGLSIYFNPNVSINIPEVGCFSPSLIDGGKPINPAAFSISSDYFTTGRSSDAKKGEELTRQVENSISIFPNPSRGAVNLVLPEGVPRNINLLDDMGRLVKRWQGVTPGVLTINSLAKGVYFLCLTDDNQSRVITKKFVVE